MIDTRQEGPHDNQQRRRGISTRPTPGRLFDILCFSSCNYSCIPLTFPLFLDATCRPSQVWFLFVGISRYVLVFFIVSIHFPPSPLPCFSLRLVPACLVSSLSDKLHPTLVSRVSPVRNRMFALNSILDLLLPVLAGLYHPLQDQFKSSNLNRLPGNTWLQTKGRYRRLFSERWWCVYLVGGLSFTETPARLPMPFAMATLSLCSQLCL